jgi:hypothetical protein
LDHIHGAHYVANSKLFFNTDRPVILTHVTTATIFPHGINIAASFNPELAYESSSITARDTRAAGVQWYNHYSGLFQLLYKIFIHGIKDVCSCIRYSSE